MNEKKVDNKAGRKLISMAAALALVGAAGSAAAIAAPDRSGKQVVEAVCAECHAAGKEGAPRIGDMEAWKPCLHDGVENLVKSAIRGHNAMPSRAGIASLSDADVRAAVIYMVNQGAANKAK